MSFPIIQPSIIAIRVLQKVSRLKETGKKLCAAKKKTIAFPQKKIKFANS